MNNNAHALVTIVKAGLWEREIPLSPLGRIDFTEVLRLAEEQAVIGLVAAGLEHINDLKVPKDITLQFIGKALQIEQRNKAMNDFIELIVERMRSLDIYTLLVKGQGIAQCYERPLWRASGDIDLYLSRKNYEKAKSCLTPLAQFVESEDKWRLHYGLTIDSWVVELHGTMYTYISRRMNDVADDVHNDIFINGKVRSWLNNGVQIFLPSPDNDVILIFNHFVNHFYGEGIGLRQICDWCRLLWTYKDTLNHSLLKSRLQKEGLMQEWKAFGALVVEELGMEACAMPFYENTQHYRIKANKILNLIIETGNFGSNKDYSYRTKYPKWKVYFMTAFHRMKEFSRIATIFPTHALKFFVRYVFNRVLVIAR